VLQVFCSVRHELLLMKELGYKLLLRWVVGLTMDERVWDATTCHEEVRPGCSTTSGPQLLPSGRSAGARSDV